MSGDVLSLTQEALWLVLLLSAPPVIVAAAVGLVIAFLQAATQLQEQTVQYLFKFFAIVVTIFVTAMFLGGTLYHFSDRIFGSLHTLVGKR